MPAANDPGTHRLQLRRSCRVRCSALGGTIFFILYHCLRAAWADHTYILIFIPMFQTGPMDSILAEWAAAKRTRLTQKRCSELSGYTPLQSQPSGNNREDQAGNS